MLIYGSSGSGGFGGDDDRGGDPPKWRPEDKVGKLVHLPRTKLKGGKHFIPANWIDRMLALAIRLSGNLGRMTNVMSDIQDVTGDEKPMELSSYHYTEKSNDTYVSLTNTKEKGLFQVMTQLRDELREYENNIFPNNIESCGDGKGRKMDIPNAPSEELLRRLAIATNAIIQFFDRQIGRSNETVSVPLTGSDQHVTWLHLRYLIMLGLGTLIENHNNAK